MLIYAPAVFLLVQKKKKKPNLLVNRRRSDAVRVTCRAVAVLVHLFLFLWFVLFFSQCGNLACEYHFKKKNIYYLKV